MKWRLTAVLAAAALAACAHTREVYLAPEMDVGPLRQVNRHVRDSTAQVALRDGRLFLADGMTGSAGALAGARQERADRRSLAQPGVDRHFPRAAPRAGPRLAARGLQPPT